MITIETIDNGFIVTDNRDTSDIRKTVFAENYNTDNNVVNIQTLLHHILDLFGGSGGIYDKERIYINVLPGDRG